MIKLEDMIAYSLRGFKNISSVPAIDFSQDVMVLNGFETALRLLPSRYLNDCRRYAADAEEFRLRSGRPLCFVSGGREHALPGEALLESELLRSLEKATEASLHTAAQSMRNGYIHYRGLRIGVCGTAAFLEGQFMGYRCYRSLAIRIPRECRGICDGIYRELYGNGFQNTLLLSPPGGGKTTALRELIRKLSDSGLRVAVVDERNEIAASDTGDPGFDLGAHTDVIAGFGKAEGAMMVLRGMNPQIMAMDEITQPEDLAAIREICGCGVGLLASIHAAGTEDLRLRPLYRQMLSWNVFSWAVIIGNENGRRTYTVRRLSE